MKIESLTLLISHVNSLIDSGKYSDITVKDIHSAIEKKGVLRYLKKCAGDELDLSVHLDSNAYGNFEEFYEKRMSQIYDGSGGKERRKWGVENLGLCLVLAWTNEIIQQGDGLKW